MSSNNSPPVTLYPMKMTHDKITRKIIGIKWKTQTNKQRHEHRTRWKTNKNIEVKRKINFKLFSFGQSPAKEENKRKQQEKNKGISWQDKRRKNELFEKLYLQIEYKIVEVFFLYAVMKSHNVWMLQFSAYSRFSLQLLEIFVLVAATQEWCNFIDDDDVGYDGDDNDVRKRRTKAHGWMAQKENK